MEFIKIIFLSVCLVFLSGLIIREAVRYRGDIRAVFEAIESKALEFIGAWVLGITLRMEERAACVYAS